MKKYFLLLLFAIIFSVSLCKAQTLNSKPVSTGWTITHPFEHNVFIENKGQFTDDEKRYITQPILYYNRLGKIRMYFSSTSITYRYDSIVNSDKDGNQKTLRDPDQQKNCKDEPQFLKMIWLNANPNVQVEVQDPESDYFTYGNPADKSGRSGIIAHAWKKLIYHNLYDNIDVEFYYPEKGGIEYNIIAHRGADISEVKLIFTGATRIITKGGDVMVVSPCLNLTNHAPIATDEKGNFVKASFYIKNNIITFKTADYDKTQTLTIDPWLTATSFFIYNLAYDIDYDNNGNVYIAGGQPPYELLQYDSSGTLNWTYNTVTSFGGPSVWYGGFTTDVRSGSTYMIKGLGNDFLAKVVKINSAGTQVAEDIDPVNVEMWRVAFDYINNQLVIAAGENDQASLVDTNLISENDIPFMSTNNDFNEAHDMSLLALDNAGTAYMATNQSSFNGYNFNNVIFKLPLPSLLPVSDTFSDHYNFTEFLSVYYYAPQINNGYDYSNGFNGMVADKNMVATYDGASLKKWRPSTNSLKEIDSVKVSGTSFQWGGLDLDCGANIYAGNNSSVSVFDSSLNFLNSIKLDSTVYALKIGNGKLYACGFGFVQSVNIAASSSSFITIKADPQSYCTGGSSVLTASGAYSYSWSPSTSLSATTGATVTASPTATTTYTVIGSGGCGTDTATVVVTVTSNLIIALNQPPTICSGDSAILSVTGGTSYTWSPATGLNNTTGDSVIANPTITTTYTVNATGAGGCTATSTDVVTINPAPNKPTITASVTGDTLISSATTDNQWNFDGTPINGATDSFLVITGHQKGWFSVTVTNEANGCTTTSDSINSATTNINALSSINNQLSIYPNPFNNNIFIKINSSASNVNEWSLELTDVLGRTVYSEASLNYNNEINLSDLPSGVYFITVINKTARAVFPVVKQN